MTQDELRLAAEYDRGYHDGKAAYDADQWQVRHDRMEAAKRLRGLLLGNGSNENLSSIARCIYEPAMNWSRGACETLRTRLVYLLDGDMIDSDHYNRYKSTTPRDLTYEALLDLLRDAARDYKMRIAEIELKNAVLDIAIDMNKDMRRKLEGYEESHIELPKDADGKRVVIGDILHDHEDGNDFHVDGFKIWGNDQRWWAYEENRVQYPCDRCTVVHVQPSPAESIVHDLILGTINESEAITRIEKLGSQHE